MIDVIQEMWISRLQFVGGFALWQSELASWKILPKPIQKMMRAHVSLQITVNMFITLPMPWQATHKRRDVSTVHP